MDLWGTDCGTGQADELRMQEHRSTKIFSIEYTKKKKKKKIEKKEKITKLKREKN